MRKFISIVALSLSLIGCAALTPNRDQTVKIVNYVGAELVQVYEKTQLECLDKYKELPDKRDCVLKVRNDWKVIWLQWDLIKGIQEEESLKRAWCTFISLLNNKGVKLEVLYQARKAC